MNSIQLRQANGWTNGYAEWIDGNTAYLSVVFSWLLPQAYQRAAWHRAEGYHVHAGGPAIAIQPDSLADVAEIGGNVDAIPHHNPNATYTTRGCIRRCKFCIVPKVEGKFRELSLDRWIPKPIICDNNFLASSRAHFDKAIDLLANIKHIDFNQGLDATLLTPRHAEKLRALDIHCLRIAWDHTRSEPSFIRAFQILYQAGFPRKLIRVYVLIGFDDTPEDALYRLETVRQLGATPFPMRYQPLHAARRNAYVSPAWTEYELQRFMRYWSNLRFLNPIPFKEFIGRRHPRQIPNPLNPFPESVDSSEAALCRT